MGTPSGIGRRARRIHRIPFIPGAVGPGKDGVLQGSMGRAAAWDIAEPEKEKGKYRMNLNDEKKGKIYKPVLFTVGALLLIEIIFGMFFTEQFGQVMSQMISLVGDNFGW